MGQRFAHTASVGQTSTVSSTSPWKMVAEPRRNRSRSKNSHDDDLQFDFEEEEASLPLQADTDFVVDASVQLTAPSIASKPSLPVVNNRKRSFSQKSSPQSRSPQNHSVPDGSFAVPRRARAKSTIKSISPGKSGAQHPSHTLLENFVQEQYDTYHAKCLRGA